MLMSVSGEVKEGMRRKGCAGGAGVVWNGITRHTPVIPAKAGIQSIGHGWAKLFGVDSRFRGNDRHLWKGFHFERHPHLAPTT